MKAVALFYGNCQAGAFRWVAPRYPALLKLFEPTSLRSFQHPTEPPQHISDDEIARCELVFEQVDGHAPLPAAIRDKLPSSAVTVRFPPLDLNLLWPLNIKDPRNVPEPDFPFGRFPYGDRIVVGLLREGLSGESAWVAYQERSAAKMPNLDRLRQMEENRLIARDEISDVKVYPIIRDALVERPLFGTINHPTSWLAGRVWRAMMDEAQRRLGLTGLLGDTPDNALQGWDPFGQFEVPVHPAVAKRLGLKWWTPDHKYRNGEGMQTWEEYMRRYIDFR